MGNNIKYLRKQAGLTQTQLGGLVGLSTSQVSKLENEGGNNGRYLSTKWIADFAKALDCQPGDLISGKPDANPLSDEHEENFSEIERIRSKMGVTGANLSAQLGLQRNKFSKWNSGTESCKTVHVFAARWLLSQSLGNAPDATDAARIAELEAVVQKLERRLDAIALLASPKDTEE